MIINLKHNKKLKFTNNIEWELINNLIVKQKRNSLETEDFIHSMKICFVPLVDRIKFASSLLIF